MATPVLDIIFPDTRDNKYLAIADVSDYREVNVNNPTIEITVPGYSVKTLDFTPASIQTYNSNTLGITCDGCDYTGLPDGIWTVKYSIAPSYKYYIEKTFIRVYNIYEKLDKAYMKMDFMECYSQIKREDELFLNTVETYIEGAVASANNCSNKLAMQLYQKANTMLTNFLNNKCNV